jgi:hypothetical protein
MENKYIISESKLIELLSAYHYANCLDAEGVDNWSWYMSNKKEYLGEFESFEEKAMDDLKYFSKIGEK